MEAREYLKLATEKTEAGDLIKDNNLTESIVKMLENYALIRAKNYSIPVVGQSEQLVCSCDNPNGFREMEEGRETCSKCKKPY